MAAFWDSRPFCAGLKAGLRSLPPHSYRSPKSVVLLTDSAPGRLILRAKPLPPGRIPLKVAVNLSPVQFRHGDLVSVVEKALRASGLDPQRLELEVTESVWIQDTDTVLVNWHAFVDWEFQLLWMTSEQAIQAWPISGNSHSTPSRSIDRLSPTWRPSPRRLPL